MHARVKAQAHGGGGVLLHKNVADRQAGLVLQHVAARDGQGALRRVDGHVEFHVGDFRLRRGGKLAVLALDAGAVRIAGEFGLVIVGHVKDVEQHAACEDEDQGADGKAGQHAVRQAVARQAQADAPAVLRAAGPEQQRQHRQHDGRAAPVQQVPALAQHIVAGAVHGRIDEIRRAGVQQQRVAQAQRGKADAGDVVQNHGEIRQVLVIDHYLQKDGQHGDQCVVGQVRQEQRFQVQAGVEAVIALEDLDRHAAQHDDQAQQCLQADQGEQL